jgi:hypothetical protein
LCCLREEARFNNSLAAIVKLPPARCPISRASSGGINDAGMRHASACWWRPVLMTGAA